MTGPVTDSCPSRVYRDNLGSLDVIRIRWLGVSRGVEFGIVAR